MDLRYMKRAINLSKLGIGYTYPNPLVGAVIVKDNKIIGEGYHQHFGENHAEINALKNAKEDVNGATMYVTLEPCSHYGKTPPCANAIVKSGIKKVIIGMRDPNSLVAGRGIRILKDNGIEVIQGVLEEEIKKVNEIFIKYITTKLPFCILKTAMTLDGKIATRDGDSKWISNEISRQYVHEIRHRVAGIMVGIGTVFEDNPSLTTRLNNKKGRDSTRIIVDSKGRIPIDSKVLNIESQAKTIIVTTELASREKIEVIRSKGAEVIITPLCDDRVDLKHLMRELGERNIDSVLLEGGAELNYSALNEGIVDKVVSFISPKIIGGKEAKTPVGGVGKRTMSECVNLENIKLSQFEEDIVIEGYIKGEKKLCSQE
ncbi:bifunctional diaminohydroxyphosphoribosylaminopyrimidine deaminase/5-amino-6-(5-phosphoribosylamino)uracil reductase RibD [Clostridium botulinum]|uniref:bifunctional diaminohydroxyphosphoribosylaminopyrimidine deaminase/5-amino-6-(5-phosphoribosylamino)uracil reductase RibD n=1 Tax=Clostridium botulinum TaxID=1491 RepID=UPI0004D36094|nr:bifunctional diaminohydroxyphosphoribosylaminopyrimidine deaminase/5-amino-6-(5-phosphoribosylamino)uracil reductase RibD [Clostridium botulinum]KEI06782.1 riboflavin biosynthesis protein RibD [Clostridium botulinum C/D str. BKT75002]KEI10892.1 riboflavin biosynthesis protein RibD [Clostridium botulinum C/D str. BKT2873]QPW60755.1 bifunctional diaminohydroxyphosphoribosylaminopyrimidine deaminase/5-amino-6-(5-phosphoribosylamino)uracil reductase RibD [Clostridium botulinum]